MNEMMSLEDIDPVKRAYRRYWLAVRNICFVVCSVLGFVWLAGVPHIQTTYAYPAHYRGTIPTATQKTSAWYISVTGWKHVKSGEYGQSGCPFIRFIPLEDCVDLSNLPFPFHNEK